LFDKNGIFCIQSGREGRWPPKFVRHGQVVYINLGNVFPECVHFLFSRIREYCREFFFIQFKPKFVCLRSMLAAKMFVIQTRNYILKRVNSSVILSVLFSILPKWHVVKTKHTCRFGESGIGRTSGGWKFPEPTERSGEFTQFSI
jgi:hypothetical protein